MWILLRILLANAQVASPAAPNGAPALARVTFLAPAATSEWSSFSETLRIVLAGVARVEEQHQQEQSPAQVARALATDAASDVAAVLWAEADGADGFTLRALARSHPEATIAVGPILRPGSSADTDRTIALKARDLLERLLAPPPPAPRPAPPPAPTAALEARQPSAHADPTVRPGWQAGVAAAAGPGPNAKAEVGLGLRVAFTGFRSEALALAALATGSTIPGERLVELREWDLAIALHGLRPLASPLAIGGLLQLSTRWLQAQTLAADGRVNQARVMVPVLAVAPELRWTVGRWFEIGAASGVEISLRRQAFSLAGTPVGDLGRFRLFALLALAGPF